MFHICATHYSNHQWHVAIEHLNCGECDWRLIFKLYFFLISLHLNSHMWLVAIVLDRAFITGKVKPLFGGLESPILNPLTTLSLTNSVSMSFKSPQIQQIPWIQLLRCITMLVIQKEFTYVLQSTACVCPSYGVVGVTASEGQQ